MYSTILRNGFIKLCSRSVGHANKNYVPTFRSKHWTRVIERYESRISAAPIVRNINTTNDDDDNKPYIFGQKNEDEFPRLIHFEKTLSWITVRFRLLMLKNAWDRQFNFIQFMTRCVKVMSKILQNINQNKMDELYRFMDDPTKLKIIELMKIPTIKEAIPAMHIIPHDIQAASPNQVQFLIRDNKKWCAIDVIFAYLKWVDPEKKDAVLYLQTLARFQKEYTRAPNQEWEIVDFYFIKCDIINTKDITNPRLIPN